MQDILLFVKGKNSENYILVGTRNIDNIFEGAMLGDPYRKELQKYLDFLITTDLLKYEKTIDGKYSLFRVKGISELQKVSNSTDPTSNKELHAIEDLFIATANANQIEYPAILGQSNTFRKINTIVAFGINTLKASVNSSTRIFLLVKDQASQKISISVSSKNSGIFTDNLALSSPYTHEVQTFFDKLVSEGIIAYVTVDPNLFFYAFKVKGVSDLQKVSAGIPYGPENCITIEELLILAAIKNGIKYPACLGEAGYALSSTQKMALTGVGTAMAVGAFLNPWVAVPLIFAGAVAKGVTQLQGDAKVERPAPTLR